MIAHDSALKGAVPAPSMTKPRRKTGRCEMYGWIARALHRERPLSGPMDIPTTIPRPPLALLAPTWADRTGPTGRKTGIWKRNCSKTPCRNCNIAQLQNWRVGLTKLIESPRSKSNNVRSLATFSTSLSARFVTSVGSVRRSCNSTFGFGNCVAFYDANAKPVDGKDYVEVSAGSKYDLKARKVVE